MSSHIISLIRWDVCCSNQSILLVHHTNILFLVVHFLIFQLLGKHNIHFGAFPGIFNNTQSMSGR